MKVTTEEEGKSSQIYYRKANFSPPILSENLSYGQKPPQRHGHSLLGKTKILRNINATEKMWLPWKFLSICFFRPRVKSNPAECPMTISGIQSWASRRLTSLLVQDNIRSTLGLIKKRVPPLSQTYWMRTSRGPGNCLNLSSRWFLMRNPSAYPTQEPKCFYKHNQGHLGGLVG